MLGLKIISTRLPAWREDTHFSDLHAQVAMPHQRHALRDPVQRMENRKRLDCLN